MINGTREGRREEVSDNPEKVSARHKKGIKNYWSGSPGSTHKKD